MAVSIFVNLPVRDLARSVAFFQSLGFDADERFRDETGACVTISDTIRVMLLTYPKFKDFTENDIADATKVTEVLLCLSLDEKSKVDALAEAALAAGATETREPMDYGFMYGRAFNDLDGHIWELIWMDETAPHGAGSA